jgi:hypothetical protein
MGPYFRGRRKPNATAGRENKVSAMGLYFRGGAWPLCIFLKNFIGRQQNSRVNIHSFNQLYRGVKNDLLSGVQNLTYYGDHDVMRWEYD